MAGIYIHVPYCKTRCIYCDFFTQTNLNSQIDYVGALCREIELRKSYIKNEEVRTIYFGGGTPSLLTANDFERIFETIYANFAVIDTPEITLEANPDDLSEDYFAVLKSFPFNRLSVGIQSFVDSELQFMNRRHSAKDAIKAIERAQEFGFDNISIDLIYGLPKQSLDVWKSSLDTALSLNIQHLSSYHLIYEEGTKLYRMLSKGKVNEVGEDLSLDMFSVMIDKLTGNGFEHYEISNFAKSGLYSKHNTSYWLGEKYLGLGPSAHSYDGVNRAFNIASINKYKTAIDGGVPIVEIEELSAESKYNDYILTGMRTMWGIDLQTIEKLFGAELKKYCMDNVQKYIEQGAVVLKDGKLRLLREGIFISDGIMSDLMYV